MPLTTLLPKHKYAALLLAMGSSQHDTAREMGLHPQTIWHWLQEPLVKDEIARQHALLSERLRSTVVEKVTQRFDAAAEAAAEELTVLSSSSAFDNVRLSASKEVIANSSFGMTRASQARTSAQVFAPTIVLGADFLTAAQQAQAEITVQPLTALTPGTTQLPFDIPAPRTRTLAEAARNLEDTMELLSSPPEGCEAPGTHSHVE